MNAVSVIEAPQPRNVELFRQSTDAAQLCKEIVVKRAIDLQGKRYVPVEGWQAIALAHGCVVSAENVRRVEGGIAADGVIRRMADGGEIARAEGFVGEDEPTWYGGQNKWGKKLERRPEFAIRAMAQTRAMSRACRTAFAHVIVMMDVGLETTPAEEMQGVYENQPRNDEPPMRNATPRAAPKQATPFDIRPEPNPTTGGAPEVAPARDAPTDDAEPVAASAGFDLGEADHMMLAAEVEAKMKAATTLDGLKQAWTLTEEDRAAVVAEDARYEAAFKSAFLIAKKALAEVVA